MQSKGVFGKAGRGGEKEFKKEGETQEKKDQ
jgi:hypothetical protein